MPSPRELARIQALGRVVFGVALTVAPGPMTKTWLGATDARRTSTAVLGPALGARDLGLGLGTARALGAGFGARPWVAAGVLADLADMVATLRRRDRLPTLGVVTVGALAGASAAVGAWLYRALD